MHSFKRSWRKAGKSWKIARVSMIKNLPISHAPKICTFPYLIAVLFQLVEISRVYRSSLARFSVSHFVQDISSCKSDSLFVCQSLSRPNWRVERTFWMRYVSFVAVSCSQEERLRRSDRVLFVYDALILEHLTFFCRTTPESSVRVFFELFLSFFWVNFFSSFFFFFSVKTESTTQLHTRWLRYRFKGQHTSNYIRLRLGLKLRLRGKERALCPFFILQFWNIYN